MAESLFSPSWYRVAELKPRLRKHAELHRHDYRGKVWYLLQDHASGRSHRFTPAAHKFIGLMDGERRVQELWDVLNEQGGDAAPTQDEVIRLLGQLHAADMLICDVTPDSRELLRRNRRFELMKYKQRFWTPLAVRFPLWDPDRFLARTLPYVRFLFTKYGALVWLLTVGMAAVLAAANWSELTDNIVDRALAPQNLLLLWLVYPVVKAVHELFHGYATKVSGGEVHEIGIMLLVLVPVPYVDASSAWGFRDKHRRMLVGGIGIMAELFMGAVALFVWLTVEPGTVHTVAYNVMLISGVSTLLFNGNPLLRFDGYYVLADGLEIPNLGNRSTAYLGYLFQKYLFGSKDAESPADTPGEARWFAIYGIAAFIYRLFIMTVIVLYIGSRFFAIGVLLAIWAIVTQIAIPVGKTIRFLLSSPKLRKNRRRALTASACMALGFLVFLFALPLPLWTRTQGVVWPPEQSQLRAGADGFIDSVLVADGQRVEPGAVLVSSTDPFLEARVDLLESHQRELELQLTQAQTIDRVQVALLREELNAVSGDLARAREQADALTMKSTRSGMLIVPQRQDLPGRYVRKGQVIAYVVDPSDHLTVRAAVAQADIGLLRDQIRRVNVLETGWGGGSYEAELKRAVPGGSQQLPTAALGTAGGGELPVDPRDPDGVATLEYVFEFELALPPEAPTDFLGNRVYVRFDHGYEPLGLQLYRSIRQLLLRQFSV
ncbi:MAG: HlyD family secretion protein [Gammaproteobacteria bacterium]|nr:HlyD family secretion protein [Gammaproteobacteria bacterium]MDH5311820.1 HlyD family secretion protein [Gammaproteobacteria bacterium]